MKKFIICALCAVCGFTTANAQKFGHVNSQEIIQAMPEFTAANAELEKLSQQYETELKQMQEELQKKAEQFEKEEATLPENIKQRRNQELQDLYQRIQPPSCPITLMASRTFTVMACSFSDCALFSACWLS